MRWLAGTLRCLVAAMIGAAVAAAGSVAFLAVLDALYRRPSREPSANIAGGRDYIVLPVLTAPVGALAGILALAFWPRIKRRRSGP